MMDETPEEKILTPHQKATVDRLNADQVIRLGHQRGLSALASVLPLIATLHAGGSSSRSVTLHNVTRCCQCGAKIGRGRNGRRCKACREVQQ